MKILYIEDEELKAKEVMELLQQMHEVQLVKSYSSGICAIMENIYDLILIDMSLPLYDYDSADRDENDFETFAGTEIMEELFRMKRNEKVIVITAFDILGEGDNQITVSQLDKKLNTDFNGKYCGIVFYDASSVEWRRILIEKMERIK